MMQMNLRPLWVLIAALGLGSVAQAASLKIATLAPEGSSWMKEMRAAGDAVKSSTDGRVELVKFIKSDPHFDSAVLAYLKKLRYKPAIYNGQAIAVYKNIKIPFTLK